MTFDDLRKLQSNTIDYGQYTYPYGWPWAFQWPYQPYQPGVCPGCGRCGTCGRQAQPAMPEITWTSDTQTIC